MKRVGAEEELEQCSIETRIIEDTLTIENVLGDSAQTLIRHLVFSIWVLL